MTIYAIITTLLLLTTITPSANGQLTPSPTNPVDAIVGREMHERRIPGLQVAVVQRGKLVFLRSYGIANVQDSVPVTNRTVFAINSCTKALKRRYRAISTAFRRPGNPLKFGNY
jgi:CubicO group peptidase (beta-lactamase class C family)